VKRTAAWYRNYIAHRTGPIPHGTQNAYANYRCRCGECTQAHREHMAEWRATR
jgi:hypothetical protein